MRHEAQPTSGPVGGPRDAPAQAALEVGDRPHRDRIDHLLVELRVELGRVQPAAQGDLRAVQLDRLELGIHHLD